MLHVATAGPNGGPLAILLHGFPEFWGAWRQHVQPLVDAGWHVAIPDQRGPGGPGKPSGIGAYTLDMLAGDVMGVTRALDAPSVSLIGHDAEEPATHKRLSLLAEAAQIGQTVA